VTAHPTKIAAVLLALGCGGSELSTDAGTTDAEPSNVSYRAVALATALDRIAILKADSDADICGLLRLASPAGASTFGITTPTGWAVDLAGISQGSDECASSFPVAEEQSDSGTGDVAFAVPAGMLFPSTLTTRATLIFETSSAPAWVPETLEFVATDLALEGI